MDNIKTNSSLPEDNSSEESLRTNRAEIEEEDFDDDFFDDEKTRKPKGKKIKRMKSNYDR